MNSVWLIYELLLNLYQGILFTCFIDHMLKRRFQSMIPCVACALLTFTALSTYLFFRMPAWDTWTYIAIIVYALVFFTDFIPIKLFWCTVLIVVTMGIAGVSYQLASFILKDRTVLILEAGWPRVLFTLISNLTMGFALLFLCSFVREKAAKMPSIALLIVSEILCALLIDIFFTFYSNGSINIFWLSIGCTVSFSIGILTIVNYKVLGKLTLNEQQAHYNEILLNETGKQVESLREIYDSMVRLQHDTRAYADDIQSVLRLPEIAEKLQTYASFSPEFMHMFFTGNTALDSVLSMKALKLNTHGIEFRSSNLHYTGLLNISDNALCSLISNLLDNATEAMIERKDCAGEHYIYLGFFYSESGLIISCENPLLGISPLKTGKTFFSTKKQLSHGTGISIMQHIMNDIHGQLDILVDDDMFKVIALIPKSSGDCEL